MDFISLGKYMQQRRKTVGLRQEDMAEMSGVTARTIYNIEEGKGNPSYKTLSKLCEVLGLDISISIKKSN
jgi:transcriptional regulator with XRE-family HTH domain